MIWPQLFCFNLNHKHWNQVKENTNANTKFICLFCFFLVFFFCLRTNLEFRIWIQIQTITSDCFAFHSSNIGYGDLEQHDIFHILYRFLCSPVHSVNILSEYYTNCVSQVEIPSPFANGATIFFFFISIWFMFELTSYVYPCVNEL